MSRGSKSFGWQPALAAALALLAPGFALAQDEADDDEPPRSVSQPVVQAIPAAQTHSLNAALGRLARNPRDVAALIDAGKAACAMGDHDAAIGFYQRADQLAPGTAQIKAGLAGSMTRNGDPFTAIPLFAEAEKLGPIDAVQIGDRGMAFDLVGDPLTAQSYYRQALGFKSDDEITRRLALSLAIAGDRRGMETALSPLLLKQDKSAWRVRAFGLAILGRADEAEAIANSTMPADLAAGMAPYLRYMPKLTAAQQASAANFGLFPRAADIGRDDPRVLAYARPKPVATLAAADKPLVPSGQPLGRDRRENTRKPENTRDRNKKPPVVAAAPPVVPQPTREERPAPATIVTTLPPAATKPVATVALRETPPVRVTPPPAPPPVAVVASPPTVTVVAISPPVAVITTPPPPAAPVQQPVVTSPGFTSLEKPIVTVIEPPRPVISAPVPAPIAAAPPVPAPPPVPTPARRPSLSEAFADLGAPSTAAEQVAGAVDVRRIAAARPAATTVAKPEEKTPPKPAHPSRIWVQLGTGRDKAALGFDWRRISREAEVAFRGKQPNISVWGQSNRLLAGPFESEAAANTFLGQLRRAGVSGAFLWTSPAGQVVDRLTVR
jgi:Flp pilus assembly protein TadD